MLMLGATGRREFEHRKTSLNDVALLLGFPPRPENAKETALQRRQRPLTSGRRKGDMYDLHAFRAMSVAYVVLYSLRYNQYFAGEGNLVDTLEEAKVYELGEAIDLLNESNTLGPALAMLPASSLPLQHEAGTWRVRTPREMQKFMKLIKG